VQGGREVYKARDTRLNRIVAIKVSNEQFSERFEREAHAVAALNHSNVCTLHDVGPNYLVMEYIEGVPLRGPLPLHQIQQAIEPHLSFQQTLYSWNQIGQALAEKSGIDHSNCRNGVPREHRSKTDGSEHSACQKPTSMPNRWPGPRP
jgi:serine/threonine protein kinase